MKRIYGKLESLILFICGAAILYYSFSGSYNLLMNPKFKWLTVTGAALLVVMGLGALTSSARRPKINIIVFTAMLLIVVLGKPHLPSASGTPGMEPEPDQGLLADLNLERFPRMEFQFIFKDVDRMARDASGFTLIGTAKRLGELDKHGSFAIMTSVMYCCLADIFATGYRVPHEDWADIKDGQPLLICGNFAPEDLQITVPNFKFGRSMFSTVNQKYIIHPDRVISYNRLDDLSPITELLDGENVQLFTEYLKVAGLWSELNKAGPFTVFVPVDKALLALGDSGFESLSPEMLRQALELHIAPGRLFEKDLMELDSVQSIHGEDLKIELKNSKLKIGGSRLLFKDTEAKNGVVHFIYPAILKKGNENG